MKFFRTSTFILLFIMPVLIFLACTQKEVREEPERFDMNESLLKADKLIESDDFDEARQLLHEIKGRDTTKKYAQLAQLKIAESYTREGEIEISVSEYRRFIEQYPDSQYAPYAQYQIATMYFSRIQGPERGAGSAKRALKEFRRLTTLYPRNPYKEVIALKIQKCLNVIADYEFVVGKFYFKKDSYKAAHGRFSGILENYPNYKDTENVLFHIALSYGNQEDMDNAKKFYTLLKERFPESRYLQELEGELSIDGK